MQNILIGIAIGIVVRHFWTPLRDWFVHTAWPWLRAKLSGETR